MSHKGNCHSQVKNNSSLKPFCKTLVKLLCSLCYECPCLPWTCLFICKSKEKTVMAPLPHPFLFLPLNQMSWNKCTAHFHDCLIKIAGVTKIVDLCSVLQMLAAEWSQNAETHIIIYDLKLFSLSTYSDICLHNIFKNKTQSKQWQRFISNTLSVPASIIRLRSIFTAICTYKNTIFLSPGEMAKELMAMTKRFTFHHLGLWALSFLYLKIIVEMNKTFNTMFFISTEWKMKWRKIVSILSTAGKHPL